MANTSRVNGFKPVKHMNGSPYNGQANIYEASASDTIPMFVGDLVTYSTNASTSGYQVVKSISSSATAQNDVTSGVIVGAIVGIINAKQDPVTGKLSAGSISLDTPNFRAASTKQFVLVADAIDLVFEAQSTASYALADVGLNADIGTLAVAGNQTTTGQSGMYVNETAPTASASRPLHVLSYVNRPDNEAPAANQKVLVMITTHAYGNAIVGV